MTKTVLVTGSSSGIGEATAQYFLKQGWQVIATARQPEKLGAWSRAGQVCTLPLDVTDAQSGQAVINEVIQRFGTLDALVNNAGIGLAGPLEAVTMVELERHFQTNFFGTVRMIQAVLPVYRKQKYGTIVNVSSVTGRVGIPYLSPYCAGKFAMEGLSESLYYELRPLGIRIKVVEPGGIKTKFRQVFSQHDAYEPDLSAVSTRMDQASSGTTPLPGPETVAEAIFTAITDNSEKLRYSVATKGALTLNRMLPERIWRAMIRKSFRMG